MNTPRKNRFHSCGIRIRIKTNPPSVLAAAAVSPDTAEPYEYEYKYDIHVILVFICLGGVWGEFSRDSEVEAGAFSIGEVLMDSRATRLTTGVLH